MTCALPATASERSRWSGVSRSDLVGILNQADPNGEMAVRLGARFHREALFLLGLIYCGPFGDRIEAATGMPRATVWRMLRLARENGFVGYERRKRFLWGKYTTQRIDVLEWFDPESGTVAFMLGAMAMAGIVRRH